MAVTQVYISAKKTLLALQNIQAQVNSVIKLVKRFDDLVNSKDISTKDSEDLKAMYKSKLKAMVEEAIAHYLVEAAIESQASEAETNSKIKGITPTIAGIPVITPLPVFAAADEAALIALGVDAYNQLTSLLNDIKQITN